MDFSGLGAVQGSGLGSVGIVAGFRLRDCEAKSLRCAGRF